MKTAVATALLAFLAIPAHAAIKTETVEYQQGDTALRGFLAYDDAKTGKRPGVLVVHEWWGLNEHAKQKARALAEAGFVGFALDMYGEGKTTQHPEEAGKMANALGADRQLAGARFQAAHEQLKRHPLVEPEKIAAIGYCFGGAVVLGMAQAGADLDGVVSFHGALPTDPVAPGTKVKAKILALHGADDPLVPAETLARFQANLTQAGADWQLVSYGGTKHSFTNPDAASHGMEALAYNPAADRRSWEAMLDLFREIFAG